MSTNGATLPNGIAWTVKGDTMVITVDLDADWIDPKNPKAAVRDDGKTKNLTKGSGGFQPVGHGAKKFSLNLTDPRQD